MRDPLTSLIALTPRALSQPRVRSVSSFGVFRKSLPSSTHTGMKRSRFESEEGYQASERDREAANELKAACELFVGNLPPNANMDVLKTFFNAAMRQVGLVDPSAPPPTTVARMGKSAYCFLTFSSPGAASAALSMNGINFLGSHLKVMRPGSYKGPETLARTWQEVIGAPPLPTTRDNADPSSGGGGAGESEVSSATKSVREVFLGNYNPEIMPMDELLDFFARVMWELCLGGAVARPGAGSGKELCTNVRHQGNNRFCFLEMRTPEIASDMLNLAGISYKGQILKMSRPSKLDPADVPHYRWSDLLPRWSRGDSKLATAGAPSNTVVLTGVVDGAGCLLLGERSEDRTSVLEDVTEEAGRYGVLEKVVCPMPAGGDEVLQEFGVRWTGAAAAGVGTCQVPPTLGELGSGVGGVYLAYEKLEDARAAVLGMRGRSFEGRMVDASFYPRDTALPPACATPLHEGGGGGATASAAVAQAALLRPLLTITGGQLPSAVVSGFKMHLKAPELAVLRTLGYEM